MSVWICGFFGIFTYKVVRDSSLCYLHKEPRDTLFIYVKYFTPFGPNNITGERDGETYNLVAVRIYKCDLIYRFTRRGMNRRPSRNIADRSHSSRLSFSSFLDFPPPDNTFRSIERTVHFVEFTGDQCARRGAARRQFPFNTTMRGGRNGMRSRMRYGHDTWRHRHSSAKTWIYLRECAYAIKPFPRWITGKFRVTCNTFDDMKIDRGVGLSNTRRAVGVTNSAGP